MKKNSKELNVLITFRIPVKMKKDIDTVVDKYSINLSDFLRKCLQNIIDDDAKKNIKKCI